ncbi:hypothetical protein F8277_08580 [Bifidobacterium longum subsp. infantis]|uniref:Uncharacterized protein n=1 Tax=Bifidobacterium longum subsp. infantis TaxID=1682 RepID=A0A0M3T6H6_BIFLI|nr:Hypothetical protein RY67_1611 [Bifidobacterium longum subsp. infantis]MSR95301.1 hypothetical protein [Bifidobacterium sp. WCA-178-WT-4B]BAJ68447.1 hypothetical protein BLIJ_0855 [Bifidobacterium longum subsp. infantis ATCC 15697 = JCM 1222 = DSM 20088]KAB1944017.1 hypothetical protein F8277_08580 [Bifidobacterium longum subsp. infantis]MED7620281.1 hypothetical protein [Bifidobacterium longum subsp. infantis]
MAAQRYVQCAAHILRRGFRREILFCHGRSISAGFAALVCRPVSAGLCRYVPIYASMSPHVMIIKDHRRIVNHSNQTRRT